MTLVEEMAEALCTAENGGEPTGDDCWTGHVDIARAAASVVARRFAPILALLDEEDWYEARRRVRALAAELEGEGR